MFVTITIYLDGSDVHDPLFASDDLVLDAVAAQMRSDIELGQLGNTDLEDISEDYEDLIDSIGVDEFIDMCTIDLDTLDYIDHVEDNLYEYEIQVDIPLDL